MLSLCINYFYITTHSIPNKSSGNHSQPDSKKPAVTHTIKEQAYTSESTSVSENLNINQHQSDIKEQHSSNRPADHYFTPQHAQIHQVVFDLQTKNPEWAERATFTLEQVIQGAKTKLPIKDNEYRIECRESLCKLTLSFLDKQNMLWFDMGLNRIEKKEASYYTDTFSGHSGGHEEKLGYVSADIFFFGHNHDHEKYRQYYDK